MLSTVLVERGKKIIDDLCDRNLFRNTEIQQGVEGEKKHAITVLGWVEKLKPNPSVALQIAALFHDVDRLITPGEGGGFKGDRNSKEYLVHKKAHAKRSAVYAYKMLKEFNLEEKDIGRTVFLIEHHDDTLEEIERYKDRDLEILVTADSFSWFSTTGVNLLKAEGVERTKDKLRFILSKTPKFALKLLPQVKIENPVLENLKDQILDEINK